jgi:hypothetical protein
VIQSVSAGLSFNAAPGTLNAFVTSTASTPPAQFNVTPGAGALFDHTVVYYGDGGQSPIVQFSSNVAFNVGGQNVTLVGYELDCNAAPCAAIATH